MLELFLETDFERTQYRILAFLQQLRRSFQKSALYPTLADLETMRSVLADTIAECERLRDETDEPHLIEDLMSWALPKVDDLLEEGRTLREFARECCLIEEIGVVPAYTNEGYLILAADDTTWAYRYRLLTTVRSLEIHQVQQWDTGRLHLSPVFVKLHLMDLFPDLPQPAVFSAFMNMPLPVEETTLPVACQLVAEHLIT